MNLENTKARLNFLKTILESQSTMQRVQVVATKAMEAEHKSRIFTDGKASDGSEIGKYSKKETHISVPVVGLPSIKPKGKTRKAKKTKYYADGYKGFREDVGRQTAKVDLNLTGTTASQLQTGKSQNATTYGFTQQRAVDIMQGNEKRYRKEIIKPSVAERNVAHNAAQREIKQLLRSV
ncbi:MAG: hypothetical protein ACPGXZ_10635 [Saprospiraceae bacterium]